MEDFSQLMERNSENSQNLNSVQSVIGQNGNQSRGQNALQRRAQQLKRWHELNESEANESFERKSSVSRVQFSSQTLFLSAVQQNDIQECERLLRWEQCDVNVTTGDGLTALHQMAIDDNRQMTQWLLDNNADVNCRDNEGWTPLHASASCGHLEIVKLLLERDDCDVFAINCDGELARDVCDGDECLRVIEDRMRRELHLESCEDDFDELLLRELRRKELVLIENDFKDFLTTNKSLSKDLIDEWIEKTRDPISGATVIHVCAAKGYNECLQQICETLKDFRIDLDAFVDYDGFTALHASAFWQQVTTFETLLNFGADFELKTRDSRVVQDLCHENPKITELMEEMKKTRQLLKEKEKEKENEKMSQSMTPLQSTTALTTSETQRKLNAKRQRETRRSTQGVAKEDVEMALKTTQNAINDNSSITYSLPAPPVPSSAPPSTTVTLTLPFNDQNGRQSQQRRRPKRRSTGIGDADDIEDNVFVATSHAMTDDNNDCVVDSSSLTILSTTPSSTSTTTPTSRSRSSSRTSSTGNTTDEDIDNTNKETAEESNECVVDTKDYKKLYKELLKENEFLLKKLKDYENNRRYEKEFQEFQREKRQLVRRISELEEELKIKEDLKQENLRLKDENSALIRVISKLSK